MTLDGDDILCLNSHLIFWPRMLSPGPDMVDIDHLTVLIFDHYTSSRNFDLKLDQVSKLLEN